MATEECTVLPQVFISYKWNNTKEDVRKFAQHLDELKMFRKVWIDHHYMCGNVLAAMEQGIKESDIVVIFFNDEYQQSKNCKVEAEAAWRHDKKIVFVKMQQSPGPCNLEDWFAPILSVQLFIDYYKMQNSAYEQILKSIRSALNSANRSREVKLLGDIPGTTPNYVPRPEYEENLKKRIKELPSGTLMVYGDGGIGKSSLLSHALSEDFLKSCGFKVMGWLNVCKLSTSGDNFDDDLFYSNLADLFAVQVSGNVKTTLQNAMRSPEFGKVLLVVDDVYHRAVFNCLSKLGRNVVAICVSRRNFFSEVTSIAGPPIHVSEMQADAIKEIFAVCGKIFENSAAMLGRLASMCCGLPLLAQVISRKLASIRTPERAKAYVDKLEESSSSQTISRETSFVDDDKKIDKIWKLLLVGFENETAEFRNRYYAFLVFDDGASVDVEDLAGLWKCDVDEATDFCDALCNRSLVRCDAVSQRFNIHSYLYGAALEFVRTQETNENLINGVQGVKEDTSALKALRANLFLAALNESTGETVLHRAVTQRREKLVQQIVSAMTLDPHGLLFDICAQQTVSDSELPLHCLLKTVDWYNKWGHNYPLETACLLVDRLLLSPRRDEARKLLTDVLDTSGESITALLVKSAGEDWKWHHNSFLVAAANDYRKLLVFLLENGVDINAKDREGNNAIIIAAMHRKASGIWDLLNFKGGKMDNNCLGKAGRTALMVASANGDSFSCRWLLEPKINVNLDLQDDKWNTALVLACQSGDPETIKMLLQRGAEVGKSEMWFAVMSNKLDAANLIFQHGGRLQPDESAVLQIKAGFGGRVNYDSKILEKWTDGKVADRSDYQRLEPALFRLLGIELLPSLNRELLQYVFKQQVKDIQKLKGSSHETVVVALFMASFLGYSEAVKALVTEPSAAPSATNSDQISALMVASANGHKEVVKILMDNKPEVDAVNKEGWTALMYAAQNGRSEIVSILLDKGADVNATSSDGTSILTIAAENGQEAVVKLLLQRKADITTADKFGATALIRAAENGQLSVVQTLLSNKADVRMAKKDGSTALYLAAMSGCDAVVKALLSAKSDIHAINNDGWTALMIAAFKGHEQVTKTLLSQKAKVNVSNKNGTTILMFAAQNGLEPVVKLLISSKAEINASNKSGTTALMKAAENGRLEVAKTLLANKANIDATDSEGTTSLMKASQNGHVEVVKLLLANKSNVSLTNKDGLTAKEIATRNGHKDVEAIL